MGEFLSNRKHKRVALTIANMEMNLEGTGPRGIGGLP